MSCKCYHADKNLLGEIGVCWGTKECEACSCNGDEAKCDFYDYVRKRARKTITNADKIRQMTDEELANWISQHDTICTRQGCLTREGYLKWLRQEVQE